MVDSQMGKHIISKSEIIKPTAYYKQFGVSPLASWPELPKMCRSQQVVPGRPVMEVSFCHGGTPTIQAMDDHVSIENHNFLVRRYWETSIFRWKKTTCAADAAAHLVPNLALGATCRLHCLRAWHYTTHTGNSDVLTTLKIWISCNFFLWVYDFRRISSLVIYTYIYIWNLADTCK